VSPRDTADPQKMFEEWIHLRKIMPAAFYGKRFGIEEFDGNVKYIRGTDT
jgi:hypothetical protein